MYQIKSHTKKIKANIELPFSKSESNRALVIQHLANKPINIHHQSDADDTVILLELFDSDSYILNCGDGGTTFRFLLAVLAFKGEEKILTGSNTLCKRPIKPLVDALNQLGAAITYLENDGFAPLMIKKGDLGKVDSLKIQANISSQFISALLMIAPLLPNGLNIILEGKILSRSYLNLTLQMMHSCGIVYSFSGNKIQIAPQQYTPGDIFIGADWSAASYFYELAALSYQADIFMKGLNEQSHQGDKIIIALMMQFGVETHHKPDGIQIIKNKDITMPAKFEFDFSDTPDLAQTFAFLCAGLNVECSLYGLDNLSLKETDRIKAIKTELLRFGIKSRHDDNLLHFLPDSLKGSADQCFQSYQDHRMIMSLAPLSLVLPHICIDNISDVSKSFPGYWLQLSKLGIEVP